MTGISKIFYSWLISYSFSILHLQSTMFINCYQQDFPPLTILKMLVLCNKCYRILFVCTLLPAVLLCRFMFWADCKGTQLEQCRFIFSPLYTSSTIPDSTGTGTAPSPYIPLTKFIHSQWQVTLEWPSSCSIIAE